MSSPKLSPLKLIIAATLLAASLGVTPRAQAQGHLATAQVGYCDLSVTAISIKANRVAVAPNGTVKQGSSLIVSCTVALGAEVQPTACDLTLSFNGQPTASIPGVVLAQNSTRSYSFTGFSVTQAVGSTLVVSCEINPHSSYIGGGHADLEKNYANNKMSASYTVVQ